MNLLKWVVDLWIFFSWWNLYNSFCHTKWIIPRKTKMKKKERWGESTHVSRNSFELLNKFFIWTRSSFVLFCVVASQVQSYCPCRLYFVLIASLQIFSFIQCGCILCARTNNGKHVEMERERERERKWTTSISEISLYNQHNWLQIATTHVPHDSCCNIEGINAFNGGLYRILLLVILLCWTINNDFN